MTSPGGFRFVQARIAALRRAVVADLEDRNRLIFHILRGGVVVSVSVLLFGFVLALLTGQSTIPDRSIPMRALGGELFRFTPAGYLSLGILVLILTPVLRVVFSLLSFLEERDRVYVLMTAIVFTNLVASLFVLA